MLLNSISFLFVQKAVILVTGSCQVIKGRTGLLTVVSSVQAWRYQKWLDVKMKQIHYFKLGTTKNIKASTIILKVTMKCNICRMQLLSVLSALGIWLMLFIRFVFIRLFNFFSQLMDKYDISNTHLFRYLQVRNS